MVYYHMTAKFSSSPYSLTGLCTGSKRSASSSTNCYGIPVYEYVTAGEWSV